MKDLIEERKLEKRKKWTHGMRDKGDIFCWAGKKAMKYGIMIFGGSMVIGSVA